MKRKKAALYDPYLDTLGGGEKHVLSIMKALQDEEYDIDIFWDHDLNQNIEHKLHIGFLHSPQYRTNIFKKKGSFLMKLLTLRSYDVFIYVTDGSYFFSSARKNFIFSMVPSRKLYPSSSLDKIKTHNFRFISNSKFTQKNLQDWHIVSEVLYPYIDEGYISLNVARLNKEKIILSVGRFFKQLHSKKHTVIIVAFQKLQASVPYFQNYKLLLVGGLKKEDQEYFDEIVSVVQANPSIELKTNVSALELMDIYKKSEIYWHFTGYGEDEKINPERVEHLGITPLESMATGCVTFCYSAGGPKELISDGKNGFLFTTIDELIKKMELLPKNVSKVSKLTTDAKEYVAKKFSYDIFKKHVKEIIHPK